MGLILILTQTYISLILHWGREEVVLGDRYKVWDGDAGEEAGEVLERKSFLLTSWRVKRGNILG